MENIPAASDLTVSHKHDMTGQQHQAIFGGEVEVHLSEKEEEGTIIAGILNDSSPLDALTDVASSKLKKREEADKVLKAILRHLNRLAAGKTGI